MEKKQIAIVTGAGGGFGREFVRLLAAEQDISEIWAIARNGEKLSALRSEFDTVRPFCMDLTDRNVFERLKETLRKEDVRVRYLVNNAGFAKFCSYDDISTEESLNMVDLNIGAVVAMCLACIPHMQQGDRIVNIASQASFQPLPYMNLYAATKAFVRNYTRALHVELKEKGITATAVCPGWMHTGLFDRGEVGAAKGARRFVPMVSPAVVAQKALRDAKKGKDMSVFGAYVKSAHFVAKILPQKTMMKLWLRQQKIK